MFDKSCHFSGSLSWLLHPILLFFFFFAYFFFGTGWYEPARLIIEGTVPDTDAVLDLQWDSGNGYNAYEQEHFKHVKFFWYVLAMRVPKRTSKCGLGKFSENSKC